MSAAAEPGDLVRAAGGVVTRTAADGSTEILLVHRPRYDDWSLPKGKLEPGETFEAAAVREVTEETGLVCTLGAELSSTRYTDRHGRPKVVRYWKMTPVSDEGWSPNHEIDELCWLPGAQAATLLSYEHDRRLVEEAV